MGWIDIVGGCELDAYGEKVGRRRYLDEADAEYRIRLSKVPSPADTRNYGGSAFPEPINSQCGGMSLRDYFAAQALLKIEVSGGGAEKWLAESAYKIADAMLAERAK